MSASKPYNPLEKENLGASVAAAMLERRPHQLGELSPFHGAGIYAIYYAGTFKPYQRLALLNQSDSPMVPIYVGKAIVAGGRKGKAPIDPTKTKALYSRLIEHSESIQATSNLKVQDFCCRYLAVDDIWIPLGESLLIAKFAPLWNVLIDGFGNHDPGKGRYEGIAPRWDVLHPGRAWAKKCRPRQETAEQIGSEVEAHLAQAPSLAQSLFVAERRRQGFVL